MSSIYMGPQVGSYVYHIVFVGKGRQYTCVHAYTCHTGIAQRSRSFLISVKAITDAHKGEVCCASVYVHICTCTLAW